MGRVLRWVAVPLAGVAVWYAVLLLGMAGVAALDALCPEHLIVSGACTASWQQPAFDAIVLLCTAVVAAGVVTVPSWVAPSQRFRVALLSFAAGALFALYAASDGSLWGPLAVAAVSGSGALWLAASRWRPAPKP